MLKKNSALPKLQYAFTLIELLAVIVVVAMIIALVVVNIERDVDQIALLEAKRFASLAQHAQDESILNGLPMGIEIDPSDNRYYFLRQLSRWEIIDDDEIFRERQIPDSVDVELVIASSTEFEKATEPGQSVLQGTEQADKDSQIQFKPQIVMDALGLVNSFSIAFSGDSKTYTVEPDLDQQIEVKQN